MGLADQHNLAKLLFRLSSEFDALVDVPTLHVLFSHSHSHPASHIHHSLGPADHSLDEKDKAVKAESSEMARVREELIAWIADEALGGDRETAEWVLLACTARVSVDQVHFYRLV